MTFHPLIAASAALAALALALPAQAETGGFPAPSAVHSGGGQDRSHGGTMVGSERHSGRRSGRDGGATGRSGAAAIQSNPETAGHWREGDGGHGHRHSGHRHSYRHQRPFPVVLVPGAAATYVAVHEDDGAGDDLFAIVNDTDEAMTVYDNGAAMCTLAPKARCSFDTSKGHHEISVMMGGAVSGAAPGKTGKAGKMVVIEGDAAPE